MARKTRSIKGEMVDFDLMFIKDKLKNKPKTMDVTARQDFVDRKAKRRSKKIANAVINASLEPKVETPIAPIEVPISEPLEVPVIKSEPQVKNALRDMAEPKKVPAKKKRTIKQRK